MQIALTGASGRVGAAVADQLIERGHTVIGLDRVEPTTPLPGVDYRTGELGGLPRADPTLRDVEAVAHLGALMSWSPDDAEALHAANVDATLALVRALGGSRVSRFVFASSGEVYPENAPSYQPLDEDHPRRPTTWYGLSKVLGEEIVAFAARTSGWDTVTLRFAHTQRPDEILDPESFFSGPRFFASRRLLREQAAGNHAVVDQLSRFAGDDSVLIAPTRTDGSPVRMGILAAADLARGIVVALESDSAGHQVVGLGPDRPTDLADLARRLAAAAGLSTVDVVLPMSAPNYETSNVRAREVLGFRPEISEAELVRLAAEAYHARHSSPVG